MGTAGASGGPPASPGQFLGPILQQEHRLSALALQVIQLLALSQDAVDRLVADHLARNPALTAGPPRRCRWCGRSLSWGQCPRCDATRSLGAEPEAETDAREQLRREARHLVRAGYEDAVDVIVDHLDSRGLLPGGVDGLATRPQDRARLRVALRAVQEAGPPGTASTDAVAGLRAQARWHTEHGGPALLVPLLRDHLHTFATDHRAAASALGVSVEAVEDAARFVRTRLTPAPLPLAAPARPAPPDVIMRLTGGRLVVQVLRAADLGLTAAPGTVGGDRPWETARAEAHALLDLLDRRATTLERVAEVVADRQQDFVLRGARWHRPLTRTEVAGALELHPSTVSRAVHGAVAAVPGGRTIPLPAFFGTAVSAREALAEMLHGQDPPHTDVDAAARLAGEGFTVARRTVTKYRHEIERSGGAEVAFSTNPSRTSRARTRVPPDGASHR